LDRDIHFTCAVQWADKETIMNKKPFTIICGVLLVVFGLDSCDTPTGQGAAAGAGAGALIGGLATGRVHGAAIGAAAGAAAGALIGNAVPEDRAREYGPPPPAGYQFATSAGGRGMDRSP